MRRSLVVAAAVAACVLGCDDDPMRNATAAVLSGQADVAEPNLQRVLKRDPQNGEAARLMAEVERLRGNFAASEKALDTLWFDRGFADPSALSPQDKALRKRMEQQYADLYVEWVEKLDAKTDPETFEAVARRGLLRDPRGEKLNAAMVSFLASRAERALEASKKAEAAAAFEELLKFRAPLNVREDAQTRARNLRLELFGDAARARVENEVKPRRLELGTWSQPRNGPMQLVTVEVDPALSADNAQDLALARTTALPAVQLALTQMLADVGGSQVPLEAVANRLPTHHTEDESLKKGEYAIRVVLSTDVAIAYLFDLEQSAHEASRSAP